MTKTTQKQWTVTRAQMKAIRAEAARVNDARRELDAKWTNAQETERARAEYAELVLGHEARAREILQ